MCSVSVEVKTKPFRFYYKCDINSILEAVQCSTVLWGGIEDIMVPSEDITMNKTFNKYVLNMNTSDKSIQSFKRIMKKQYGQDLTDNETREQRERLVKFFELLIKIDRRNKLKSDS